MGMQHRLAPSQQHHHHYHHQQQQQQQQWQGAPVPPQVDAGESFPSFARVPLIGGEPVPFCLSRRSGPPQQAPQQAPLQQQQGSQAMLDASLLWLASMLPGAADQAQQASHPPPLPPPVMGGAAQWQLQLQPQQQQQWQQQEQPWEQQQFQQQQHGLPPRHSSLPAGQGRGGWDPPAPAPRGNPSKQNLAAAAELAAVPDLLGLGQPGVRGGGLATGPGAPRRPAPHGRRA